jgi:hypothetical protein
MVMSFKRRQPVTVGYESVVSISPVVIPASLHTQVVASLTNEEKKKANDYWAKLYSYDPAYLREVQKQVNEGTVA